MKRSEYIDKSITALVDIMQTALRCKMASVITRDYTPIELLNNDTTDMESDILGGLNEIRKSLKKLAKTMGA